MSTLTFCGTVQIVYCYKCGVPFGLSLELYNRRCDDGESFWCPNGHSQHFTESNVQRLERILKSERSSKEYWQRESTREAQERIKAERRLSATQGVVTRIKKRVANGVCPCCKRHFVNLEKHMHGQHPDYVEPA